MKQTIYEALVSKPVKLCVLATSSLDGKPECAVLAYAINNDLSLIVSTHKSSRKWNNIKNNNNVAVVFGQSFTELYVQYEGKAELITEGEAFEESEKMFFDVNPHAKQFQNEDTAFVKIKPVWLRSTDFTVKPPETTEVKI